MSGSPRPRTNVPHERLLVPALLALFAVAGLVSLVRDAPTFDETAHLPAGLTYLERGDFRLNPEHPPLTKAWAALPVWMLGLAEADYDSPYWRGRPAPWGSSGADQWRFGYELLNGPIGARERRDPRPALHAARAATLALGVLLGLLVYAWSRSLWGARGALLSLSLYALSPTMLAHSRLVTTDVGIALGFTAVLFAFHRCCSGRGRWSALLLGGALGGALLVKFSALLLLPLLAVLATAWWLFGPADAGIRGERLRRVAVTLALALPVAFGCIWAGYGFRSSLAADPRYRPNWEIVERREGPVTSALEIALEHEVLPEGYLYGLAYFLGGAGRRVAYLNGAQSLTGWWYYFPECLLLKTPPATLVLLGWAALIAWRRRSWRDVATWILLLPILVYLGVSVAGNLNIGHRHLVPLYPLLFVLAGIVGREAVGRRNAARALAILLFGAFVSFAFATPRYLSYFNLLAGGPRGAPRYLLDSNIDWGQDLDRLAGWMRTRGIDRIDLAYFGTADPEAYGIRYRKIRMTHDFHPRRPAVRPAPGELAAVSVNLLHGLYLDEARLTAEAVQRRGWVHPNQIRRWSELRDARSLQGKPYPDLGDWLVEAGALTRAQWSRIESQLLSTWLRELRENGELVARIGDSILVYRVP